MRVIAHRGNLDGPTERENEPAYIDEALAAGFDVEVDIRIKDGQLYLGHDEPQYLINYGWLVARSSRLWIHCKDIESLRGALAFDLNCFYHQADDYTLTSRGDIWAYPECANPSGVVVDLEGTTTDSWGVCTDYPIKYK